MSALNPPHLGSSDLQALLQQAKQAAQAGRLGEAETACRKALAKWPRQADACYLLGEVLARAKRHDDALATLKQAISSDPALLGAWLAFARVCAALPAPSPDALRFLRERLTSVPFSEKDRIELTKQLLKTLGFVKSGDRSRCALMYRHFALPCLCWGLNNGCYDFAMSLEEQIYNQYIKQTEEKAHFEACYRDLLPPLLEAGRRAGSRLPNVPISPEPRPKVAFFLPNAQILAHTEVLLSMLEGWAQLKPRPFDCVVYCLELATKNGVLTQRLSALGIPMFVISSDPQLKLDARNPIGFYGSMLRLREMLTAERVSTLVWLSNPLLMPFTFGLRVAPVQVWWAMKYHSLEFPEIDGYITGGSLAATRCIDGRVWRNGLLGLTDWFDSKLADQAVAVRSTLPAYRLLAGTMGREEKLADPAYLATVCALLKKHPDVGFLWTGKAQLPTIQKAFEQAGVAKRCHFIGWVDTKLYAQVLDVYLDSFPFPSGFTLYQSLTAGVPVVLYASPESLETGLPGIIWPALSGEEDIGERHAELSAIWTDKEPHDLFCLAKDTDAYLNLAERLLGDDEYRRKVGAAGRQFMERFMSSPKEMGESYSRHILEIIAERTGQTN